MLTWAYFPRSAKQTELAELVVQAFQQALPLIDSEQNELPSNHVLRHVGPHLHGLGFIVETGKKRAERINVPVLYGNNGRVAKSFDADAHHVEGQFVVEIEAGRAVTNNQFLKDLFQACMMDEIAYLAIAVRKTYRTNRDFAKVVAFFETLFASDRMRLPLKGILIIGY